ncbi:tol-pal system protein YbgF [Pleomorphomonas sp. JP5]|uniref:tol-pal system protein YbgF n=1 Tax=Pleomorphomonas sp. JP5 TaxID=2942998 RepID=UPI002042D425|nr:tol-pal system protein YbgF [Pleomorphomonas sp. JP5]MCM5556786.1 tol-pal system protein YbgF [Pleomorphomonas sp. JP5]
MTSRLFRPPSHSRFATLAVAALGFSLLAAAPASAGLFGSDPVPPASIPGQQDAAQQAVRLDNVEQQMRQLNGRIDELTHQIQQLQNLLKRAQEDNEFRLQQLEGGKGQKRSDVAPPAATSGAGVGATATAEAPMDSVGTGETLQTGFAIDAPGTVGAGTPPADDTLGAPPAPLGTLPGAMADSAAPSASAVGGPLDLSAIARGELAPNDTAIATSGGLAAAAGQDLAAGGVLTAPPVADATAAPQQMASIAPPTVDPGADYDRAYSSIVSGDYAAAETGFKKFLTDFPGDPRAADAQYWLGESYYSRKQYRDAATSYLATYKNHPTSQKAPDSLFKLGLSLEGLGETSAACATYGELTKKFPKAQSGLVSRVATRKQKLGCS